MSASLDQAEQLLAPASGRPDDYALRTAEAFAAVATARALEQIAASIAVATGTAD